MTKDDHSLGYISLHRSILDWEWYGDPNTCRLFIHLLLTANYTNTRVKGQTIRRGQRFCTVRTLAKEVGLSERQTRTALDHLRATQEVTHLTKPEGTVITIKNYGQYQNATQETTRGKASKNDTGNDTTTDTRKKTRKRCGSSDGKTVRLKNDTGNDTGNDKPPTHDRHTTFKNKDNKENIYIRSDFPVYGEFENVHLSDEELDKLKGISPVAYQDYIERLSAYMASSGKTYKNHYATIRNWIRRDGLINKTTEEDDRDVL